MNQIFHNKKLWRSRHTRTSGTKRSKNSFNNFFSRSSESVRTHRATRSHPFKIFTHAIQNIISFVRVPTIGGKTSRDKIKVKDLPHHEQFGRVPATPRAQKPADTASKVFQPAKDNPVFSPINTVKTSLYQTYFGNFFKINTFQWGVKNPNFIKPAPKSLHVKIGYTLNYYVQKIKLLERFNRTMLLLTVGSLSVFFLYLCFFDTYFIVKDYTVTFAEASYLSPEDVQNVITTIKTDKLIGFIPNNQFWFLSSRSATIAAQNEYSEIDSIKVRRKLWPNRGELEIKTEPILVTLGINQSEYWRIGYDGSVVSRDDAGLRDNLVIVERPVTLNRPDATLQDYSFAGNCDQSDIIDVKNCTQLNRFWFVVWLWTLLDQLDINYTKTVLPSLFDSDVVIELQSGSRLIFDSSTMSKQVQKDRIVSVLGSLIGSQVNSGEVKYVDFRQPKKVYLCRVNQGCG